MFPFLRPLALAALAASPLLATTSPSPGWQRSSTPAVGPGVFVAGMDYLPNGNLAVYDGSSIVEIDPATGNTLSTLFTPPTSVFGSFVKTSPSGTFLLFGESSNNQVWKVPVDGSTPSVVATINFVFDLTFQDDQIAFVSAAPVFGQNQILRLDLATGTTDVIADFIGASGVLACDSAGTLFYGEASIQFPVPPPLQDILRFDATQVAWAIGPNVLQKSDATPIATGYTYINDLVVDAQGDVIAIYSPLGFPSPTFLREFSNEGTPKGALGETLPGDYAGPLAYRAGAPGSGATFGPYQSIGGGELAVITTDFFSYTDLDVYMPKRATLATTPTNPIPQGNFTFSLSDGPLNGLALFLVGSAPAAPEFTLYNSGVAFSMGLAPGSIALSVPALLDMHGGFTQSVLNHGSGGTTYVQAVLIDSGGLGVGTSTMLPLVLQ